MPSHNIANTANDKTSPDAVTEFEVRIRILNSSYQDLIEEQGSVSPFRPGMTASVDVTTEVKDNILTIPLASVTTRNPNDKKIEGEEGDSEDEKTDEEIAAETAAANNDKTIKKDESVEVVFLLVEGTAKMVEVKTGISDFESIEILEGVAAGDKVVKGPFIVVSKRLKDGDLVIEKSEEAEKKVDEEEKVDEE